MKKFVILLLLCLMLLVPLFFAISFDLHPGGSAQADLTAVTVPGATANTPVLTNLLLVAGTNDANVSSYYNLYRGAILFLTLTLAGLIFRKHFFGRLKMIYTQFKARVRGSLAAGDQLKFPIAAG